MTITMIEAKGQPSGRPHARPSIDSIDAQDPMQDTLRTDLSSHLSSHDEDAVRRADAGSPRSPIHDTAHGQHAPVPDHIPAEHMVYYSQHSALADEQPDRAGESDLVQVRELLMGSGRKATVVMEAGRIRRIVTTDGQVAELQWASSPRCPLANQGRIPLSVSLSSMERPVPPSDRAGRAKEKLLSEPVLPRMWTKLSGSARLASGSNLVPPRPDVTPASINALHYEEDLRGGRGRSGGSTGRRSQSAGDVDTLRRGLYAPSIEPQYRGRHTDRPRPAPRPHSASLHQTPSQDMPTIVESQYSGQDAAAAMREAAGMPHPALRGSSGAQLPSHAPTTPRHKPGSYAPQPAAGARSWQGANAGMPTSPIVPPPPSGGEQIRRSRSHPAHGSAPRSQRAQSSRSISRAASLPATAAEAQRQLQQPLRPQKVGFWRRLKKAIFPTMSLKRFRAKPAPSSDLLPAARALSRSRSRGAPTAHSAALPEPRSSRYAAPIADTAFEQPGRGGSRMLPATVQQQPPLRQLPDRWGSGSYRDSVPVSPKSQTYLDGPPSRLSRDKARPSNDSSLGPSMAHVGRPAYQENQQAIGNQRSSRLDSLASIDPRSTSWQTHTNPMLAKQQQPTLQLAGHDMSPIEAGGEMLSRRERRRRDSQISAAAASQLNTLQPKLRVGMVGRWRRDAAEGISGSAVDDLLQMSPLQRLAREKITELEMVELEGAVQIVWHICLNRGAARISKTEHFLKSGEVMEGPRRDGRPGILRSQLSITPEGHVHIRSLQSEPFSAVFHDRFKLSTGARRIKFDQKFQLLAPGVLPVKHYSIWHRVTEE